MKKVPEELDAIVIGSGIGGMSCAAILARSGKRVLVLEQHTRAGGCCHTFTEQGFEFDAGIHMIGDVQSPTIAKVILDQISSGQLQWAPIEKEYDVLVIGQGAEERKYSVFSGREKWRETLLEKFPNEREAIDSFLKKITEFRRSVLGLFLVKVLPLPVVRFLLATRLFHFISNVFSMGSQSADSYIRSLTDNKDLRAVLGYNYGDIGVIPDEETVFMQQILTGHFMGGASYPVGGASEIAYHTIPSIEQAGGRVLVRAPVNQILLNDRNEAIGVRIEKGGESFDVHAPLVISACGMRPTFNQLLPQHVAHKTNIGRILRDETVVPGYPTVSLFVGLNGSAEDLGLKAQNYWISTGNDLVAGVRRFLSLSAEEASQSEFPLLFASFPSVKDPTHAKRKPGKSTCTIIAMVNYKWFEEWEDERVKHRGARYESFKEALTQNMWHRFCELFPHIKDKVEYMELGSPLSNNFYLGVSRGEIYGLDHTVPRFSAGTQAILRPDSGVKGLYLTGQDVLFCGFVGALFSGVLTASVVLDRNLVNDVTEFRKKHYPRPEKLRNGAGVTNGVHRKKE